jgi:DNA polymerase-2
MATSTGFILTRTSRDTGDGCELEYWVASESGPARVRIALHEPVFFVECGRGKVTGARREPLELATMPGVPVDGVYFRTLRQMREARESLDRQGVPAFESDVKPEDRFLMERFVRGSCLIEGEATAKPGYREFANPVLRPSDETPQFKVLSLDIETHGFEGAIYSVGVASPRGERVFMLGAGEDTGVVLYFPDEKALLENFFEWLAEDDPDLILGWNVADFDLMFMQRKCDELRIPFRLGRAKSKAFMVAAASQGQSAIAKVPGRVVLDGIHLLRLGFWDFESYALDHVASEMLGRKKLITGEKDRLAEIRRIFREDKPALAAYNLEDCRLALEIFEKARLVHFAAERSRLTGQAMDRQGGSVAAFDFLYLPRLHRAGCVAPDVGAAMPEASPGGFVMESVPGLYDNVLVLDFKSLYPSIIRTFKIDPLGMARPGDDPVPGFGGANFNRERHILPGLVEELWRARDVAKRDKNTALSTAIKIIMNSLYGVLGTSGCRFFDARLASSITRRGHDLIRRSREWIETQGRQVLYGDTDSLFVLVGPGVGEAECAAIGGRLAEGLNAWWTETIHKEFRLDSHLEIQFEKHFLRFFMPTIRGTEVGSKKRYAGYVQTAADAFEVEFTGMESVRTDWTPLAREFQRELFRRIFAGEPFEDYIRETASAVLAGKHDAQLVYRKRLRRKLEEYTKVAPPHVQAARKLERPGRSISYVITLNGPEPVEARKSPLDYGHYLDRQLAPVADAILHVFDQTFEKLTSRQMEMF